MCLLRLLCVVWCIVSSVHGGVLTENVTLSKLDESVTLRCKLQKPAAELTQVTWQKIVGKTLVQVATYSPKDGPKVQPPYENRVNITMLGLDETTITVRVTQADEGMYQCLFNIFPIGSVDGKMFINFGDVLTDKSKSVRLGESVSLNCVLWKPVEVTQMTWQKTVKDKQVDVAILRKEGAEVMEPYKDRLKFSFLGMNDTWITVRKVQAGDEGVYRCLFNTSMSGTISGETSIDAYEPLSGKMEVKSSNGKTNVTCVATGYPQPNTSWIGAGEGNLNESVLETHSGVVTVKSWIVVNATESELREKLECKVQHAEREAVFKIPVKSYPQTTIVVLIVVLVVLVLALVLVICRAKKRRK